MSVVSVAKQRITLKHMNKGFIEEKNILDSLPLKLVIQGNVKYVEISDK